MLNYKNVNIDILIYTQEYCIQTFECKFIFALKTDAKSIAILQIL